MKRRVAKSGKGSLRFDTSRLRALREVLDQNPEIHKLVGQIFSVRIIVDANFVIADLMRRVRFPDRGITALEEVANASVVEVYAPTWLDEEIESVIPRVASKRGLPESALREEWQRYKKFLKWDERFPRPRQSIGQGDDPKDEPYLSLEKVIVADGILSRDKDIRQMGGHPLTLDFVLSTREYARSIVVTVSVRLLGVMLGVMAVTAIATLLKALANAIARLPTQLKVALLAITLICLLHPGSRKWVTGNLKGLGTQLEPLWSVVAEVVAHGAQIARSTELEAKSHLLEAQSHLRPPISVAKSHKKRVRRRVGARRKLHDT